ncbi:tRNA methyltransferase complex GCD14 subunit [Thermothelomyces heterothallicus CBS 203.75]
MASTTSNVSPFLDPGPRTKANSLAILQLSRDNLLPVYLQPPTGEHDGYAEGAVVNTRYGSFPHSTMLDVPWGSQIRASKVDTGSRGRKRKRDAADDDDAGRETTGTGQREKEESPAVAAVATNENGPAAVKKAVADTSGFIHILPPTPELWTSSLPHRTQVVYTPDYSYILHRIRARPGSVLIEAGAGSGSFTHAAVRAVYNGYPTADGGQRKGKVYSFEFHEQRYHKMKKELSDHGLDRLVHLTHRDVYNGGFLVDGKSPEADAVFLDLPAPWEALPHLSRRKPHRPSSASSSSSSSPDADGAAAGDDQAAGWVSPLNPRKSVHICTFSPCIEQVTRTVSAMRRLGWVDIDMVEIANRRLHTSRERVGLNLNFDRGVNNSARDVEEALARLTEIEARTREHSAKPSAADADEDMDSADDGDGDGDGDGGSGPVNNNNGGQAPSAEATSPTGTTPPWMEGRLITRGEPEIKTHTSYLVFAVLPMEWTAEDEAAAAAKYPVGREQKVIGAVDKLARKQERREQLQKVQGTGGRKARRKERDEKLGEMAA